MQHYTSFDGDKTEGMVFFIFDHEETTVRELLDGGGFVEAGEGLEGWCEVWRHEHILSFRHGSPVRALRYSLERQTKKGLAT